MFNFFKKDKWLPAPEQTNHHEYNFRWLEAGSDSPFNKKVLDVRSFTQAMLSTTQDKELADLFIKRRASIGEECINANIPDGKVLDVTLSYPHNGDQIEGAGYRAVTMEDKWDIYAWNNIIYFVRSWTGDIIYKAFFHILSDSFSVYQVEYHPDQFTEADPSLVVNNVHFLIKTHLFKLPSPHKAPAALQAEQDIAMYSFSQFGHNCGYATFDDILDAVVVN